MCVLENLGFIVKVWDINCKYDSIYFWILFLREWECKKMASPHSRANLDFAGVIGEEE